MERASRSRRRTRRMPLKPGINTQEQEQMTIFVESLTGTTFEVIVSSEERVKSIKSKIQKLEGIPVAHQHLLYRNKELEDSACVSDPSVDLHDQTTIKLVLSMRGGPISLVHHAVPINRTFFKNLVKLNREEMDEITTGCKMAVLVLRVGDQLNLLHVVDDGDEGVDSASEGKDNFSFDLLEGESSKTSEENFLTMEKVCDLKERMDKLSLQRKSIKTERGIEETSSKNPENAACPSNPGSSKKLPSIGQKMQGEVFKSRSEFSQIPVLPDIVPQPFKNSSGELEFVSLDEAALPEEDCDSLRPKTCPGTLSESQIYNVLSDAGCHNSLQFTPPQVRSCVSACASKLHHEWGGGKSVLQSLNILPPISGVSDVLNNHRKIAAIEPRGTQSTKVPSIEKINLRRNLNIRHTFKYKQNLRKDSQSNLSRNVLESGFSSKNMNSEITRPDQFGHSSQLTSPDCQKPFPRAPGSNYLEFSWADEASRLEKEANERASSAKRLGEEAKGRVSSVKIMGPDEFRRLAREDNERISIAKRLEQEAKERGVKISWVEEYVRLGREAMESESIAKRLEEDVNECVPSTNKTNMKLEEEAKKPASSDKEVNLQLEEEAKEHASSDKKVNFDKKLRLRCAECKKKLSLTSTFECRCGFAFCSYHRYSETHHCTYDFKKESRKLLELANPTIVAPKLPKM